MLLNLGPGILAHDPFHDQHLVALRDRRNIDLNIIVEAERARGEREEGIDGFERRKLAELCANDLAVAEMQPAIELLLTTHTLHKDCAGLLAQIQQLNNIGEREITQVALQCHDCPTERMPSGAFATPARIAHHSSLQAATYRL